MTTTNTSKLWDETHTALCEGRLTEARRLLDELCQRTDNHDLLCSAEQYGVPAGQYRQVIQDRIDLVNARA